MTTAHPDRTLRVTKPRSGARLQTVGPRRAHRPALSTNQVSAMDPAKATIAADVMAALAAFGLED